MTELTAARVRELLHYDPETGVFAWRVAFNRNIKVGAAAGGVNPRGYHRIAINRRYYQAHRLAWLYITDEWPPEQVDHINGDPSDNRWANLRLATQSQNQANARRRSDNTSGYKGVSWDARSRKWSAEILVGGRRVRLGRFGCPAEAHAAYVRTAEKLSGEFARVA
jgi:hypothetical protein